MRDIIVLADKEKDRLILSDIFTRIGANPFFAIDLNEAFRLLEKNIPRAIFIVEGTDPPTEIKIRELKRIAPLMPLSILLRQRDSSKAIEYMKLGAFDCAQPPWTEEEILPLLKKSLLLTGTEIKFEKPKRDSFLFIALAIFLILLSCYGFYYYGRKIEKNKYETLLTKESVILPEKNIAGIFFDEKSIYIASWFTQNIYKYDKNELKLLSVKKIPGKIPVVVSDQISNFIVLNDENEIEKRLKDENYTLIGKTKLNAQISDICFDKMYLWTLNKKMNKIEKRITNENLDILSEFPLSLPAENLACNNKRIYFYNKTQKKIYGVPVSDPQKILSEFPITDGEIISISFDENKLWYIVEGKNGTILKYIKDEI